ncbi:uncharacterized protein LOC130803956 [Amaranthus tricolor]|uniref:uncharacterized protein LOC130803956 n=1 Tax=Amaranthus tricolor TaxID=29722 RepID=UPI00258C0BA6|nr:uncharacterized protein LOC130803956 [Amaranthus tricolor]
MPYEIWGHISKRDWEAFVAKRTTPIEVEKRGNASDSASKRKFYHRLGQKTYDEVRKEWVDAGLYPNQSSSTPSSTTTSASVNTLAGDRVRDWYCGLHSRDASGKFTINDPGTKKVADAVMDWKEKEATGEFTPRGNVDALHMVLGKDHSGQVVGKVGVRVGLQKAFGKECVATQSRTALREEAATLRAEITKDVLAKLAAVLQKMGVPIVDLANLIVEDQESQHGDTNALVEPTPEPITPVAPQLINNTPEGENTTLENINFVAQYPEPTPEPVLQEATPCSILLPQLGVASDSDLTEVTYGVAQPNKEGQTVHSISVTSGHISVAVEAIVKGFEDFSLPITMPAWSLEKLSDALGSFVTWPYAWVRFTNMQKSPKGSWREVGSSAKVSTGSKSMPSTPILTDEELKDLSQDCKWLHYCASRISEEDPIILNLLKEQYCFLESPFVIIGPSDIGQFLRGEMLNVTLFHVYMSAAYEELNSCEPPIKIGWFCPESISGSKCRNDPDEVRSYIETALTNSLASKHTFILAPYVEDLHWILLIICPLTNTVHVFDSLQKPQSPPRNTRFKALLNAAMNRVRGQMGSTSRATFPKWTAIKCFQQPSSSVDCDYYALKYMDDIIKSVKDFGVENIDAVLNDIPRETRPLRSE